MRRARTRPETGATRLWDRTLPDRGVDYEPERLAGGTERPHKNYYVQESVGIAVGILLTALHTAGLATLTPSPMGFLARILGRPKHERPYRLIPVGYPARDARVPDIARQLLADVRLLV